MTIRYRINEPLKAEELAVLFASSGIERPIEDLARLQKMLDNANFTLTAWDDAKLIGIARSVTDFCFCCYLSDLAVAGDYQRQGIGKELVKRTKEELGEQVSLILLAAPTAMAYYPRIGMAKIENGWRIKRTK